MESLTMAVCVCVRACGAATGKAGVSRVRCVASQAASVPKREKDAKKRVVITGMGLVSVFGNDVNTFYDKLLEGTSGIDTIDRFDISKFPTKFAGQIRDFCANGYIDGKNDRRLDDSLRYCLVSGKKALEDAGLGGEHLDQVKSRIRKTMHVNHVPSIQSIFGMILKTELVVVIP